MDKYDAANDHYCYPNTGVLINLLNIQDAARLEEAERLITSKTVEQVHYQPPPYDLGYFQHLHYTLFSPLYDWAGKIRDVSISKGGTVFCVPVRIEAEAQKLFRAIAARRWLTGLERNAFCHLLAEFYCEFNMIHPFREGNGRVQRLFFEHLALSCDFELDWSDVTRPEWIQANIDGVNVDYSRMTDIFDRVLV